MVLNLSACNVDTHIAAHLHRHVLLKNRPIDFPANVRVAADVHQPGDDVRIQIRLRQDPIRHYHHRRADRLRPPRPRRPWRRARLPDRHAAVEERRRHVPVLDRREVRIPHPHVGDQSHVAAADLHRKASEGDVSDSHDRTSEPEHRRDQDRRGDSYNEEDRGGPAAASDTPDFSGGFWFVAGDERRLGGGGGAEL